MPTDLEGLRNKQARRQSRGWSAKEGDNLIRILPHTTRWFTEGVSEIALEFHSHFLKAEGNDTEVFRCARDKKETCAFCEAIARNKESTDPVLKKTLDQIRRAERHLFNIVNLNDIPGGVQTYETGPKLYDDAMAFIANPAWGDMVSPTEGRNWTIQMTPQGKSRSGFQEYKLQPHPDKTDITPMLGTEWKAKLDDIENAMASYPDAAATARWLDILGLSSGASVATPVATPAPAVVAAPAPAVVATPAPAVIAISAPVVVPTPAPPPAVMAPPAVVPDPTPVAATTAGPVASFCASNKNADGTAITPVMKKGLEVPSCYSEGSGTSATSGFNPQRSPCEKGCPVKAQCQLTTLGLA